MKFGAFGTARNSQGLTTDRQACASFGVASLPPSHCHRQRHCNRLRPTERPTSSHKLATQPHFRVTPRRRRSDARPFSSTCLSATDWHQESNVVLPVQPSHSALHRRGRLHLPSSGMSHQHFGHDRSRHAANRMARGIPLEHLQVLTFGPPVSEKALYLGPSSMLSDSLRRHRSSWRPTSATDRRGRSMRIAATA